MKRHLVTSALALLLATSATPAFAREALVIIRFNQARVYYDNQLYQAISKAVAIKPDLMIDVVSYSPETNDTDTDEQWQQAASQHTQQVVNTLQQIGVPRSRISVSGERVAGIRTDETHIFVQ